ncbi:hypothetical protein QFZ98_003575 [Paraburkholderia youngii]
MDAELAKLGMFSSCHVDTRLPQRLMDAAARILRIVPAM